MIEQPNSLTLANRINAPQKKAGKDMIEVAVKGAKEVFERGKGKISQRSRDDLSKLQADISEEKFRDKKDAIVDFTHGEAEAMGQKIKAIITKGGKSSKESDLASVYGIIGDEIERERKESPAYFPKAAVSEWDGNQDFFRKGYEYKYKKIKNEKGATINLVEDVGLTFYRVEKGDSIAGIRQKLSYTSESEFKYIATLSKKKIESFNIQNKKLIPGMLIPIPPKIENSILSDKQFANYCQQAIDEMKTHPKYRDYIAQILEVIPEDKLVTLMIAVAKQESGGDNAPIGSFALHRWEPGQSAFSFTYYHVLMKEAGLEARRKLGLTEGQACHPKNASKLFLAFLIEKAGDRGKLGTFKEFVAKYFPPAGSFQNFAAFYNGGDYKKNQYDTKLEKFFEDSEKLIATANIKEKPETPKLAAKPETPKPVAKAKSKNKKSEKPKRVASIKDKPKSETFFAQAKEAVLKLFK
ncbi:MAG: N-acetylmuramidase domain-containing protein [Candidatus Gracilibacteria bacterium]|jgi:hypothetical protein